MTSAEEEAKIAGDDAALEATPDKAKERNEKKVDKHLDCTVSNPCDLCVLY